MLKEKELIWTVCKYNYFSLWQRAKAPVVGGSRRGQVKSASGGLTAEPRRPSQQVVREKGIITCRVCWLPSRCLVTPQADICPGDVCKIEDKCKYSDTQISRTDWEGSKLAPHYTGHSRCQSSHACQLEGWPQAPGKHTYSIPHYFARYWVKIM